MDQLIQKWDENVMHVKVHFLSLSLFSGLSVFANPKSVKQHQASPNLVVYTAMNSQCVTAGVRHF